MRPDQIERFARHLVLKEIGGSGQNALLNANIAIVGVGGLGGPAALYLAAAGVGKMTLIDDDHVSLSNLQRQIQFDMDDMNRSKVNTLKARLSAINPDLHVNAVSDHLTSDNAPSLLIDHDMILDGTDRFSTRFTINDAALALQIPLLSGAVGRFDGQVGIFEGRDQTACYRCLVRTLPPQEELCSEVGVIGALTGIIGSVMALEAIKWITCAGETLAGRLWIYDGLRAQSRTVTIPRDPDCPACSER